LAAQTEAAAAFGLKPETIEQAATLDVWPENWIALCIFADLRTQWTLTPNGQLFGLRYEVLPMMYRLQKVPQKDQLDVLHALRVLESHTVELQRER
jgi:Phage related hypothetical protein (DUF1799)